MAVDTDVQTEPAADSDSRQEQQLTRTPYIMDQKTTSQTSNNWTERFTKISLSRRLPSYRLDNRNTALVLILMAGVTLLLHTSNTTRSPIALGEQYHRITGAAYNRFKSAFKARGDNDIEPLSGVYCSSACPCACRPWLRPNDPDPPEPAISNCGPTADRRGKQQDVLAFSYYGSNVTAYLDGIAPNAMKALDLYPGWTVRVYYDGQATFPAWNKTACDLICRFPNVDLCDVRHLPGLGDISNQTATVWRFAVIADESVDRFLMRDLDTVLSQRERSAVDEWLASNKTFHTMRDHPFHGSPILAGMWGGWNRYNEKYGAIRRKMFAAVNPVGKYWWDQRLLASILWPELTRTGDVMTHDSYQCLNFPHTRPFPTQRKNLTEFVGSQLTRRNIVIQKECPLACRPPQHMDWKYC